MRKTHGGVNQVNLFLMIALILAISTGCASLVSVSPANTKQISADAFAYSRHPRDSAETEADDKACREWAKEKNSHDPSVEKKWTENIWESAKELLGRETEDERWKRAYSACMEARDYVVK